jgi:formate--tetrahydrofolate ligase
MSPRIKKIKEVYKKYGVTDRDTTLFGDSIAKIKIESIVKKEISKKNNAKLILVTAVSPTASGEGKTTVSIGLAQALNKQKVKAVLALREPSLGPVFGMKGGATGGAAAQILPSDEINLHFTGDMHAITSANNLLAAAIDNHIYFGNSLEIEKSSIVFKRCLDVNDRTLRWTFNITAASEMMAMLCLACDMEDLRKRINRIVIGQNTKGIYIYAKDIGVTDALLVLLGDAMMPNIVQSTEGGMAFVHGGPFANIAHGCNSLLATRAALAYGDVCITEAGFGADLGAEKFFNIKLRAFNNKNANPIWPACVVLVATCKSVAAQGEGYSNLERHIQNMQRYGADIVVAINIFKGDREQEVQGIINFCAQTGVVAFRTSVFADGGNGAAELAAHIKKLINKESKYKEKYLYKTSDSIEKKIEKIAQKTYGAKNVVYTAAAQKKLELLQKDFGKLPVCIAKNQYSFSDNAKLLGAPIGHTLNITDLYVQNGAGFVTALAGTVYTMPGLSRHPQAEKIKYTKTGEIKNLK